MKAEESQLNEEVATRLMGWHRETVQDDFINGGSPFDNWVTEKGVGVISVADWLPSVAYTDAFVVIDAMYKKHHLSCRIALNGPQIVAAFYETHGISPLLTEEMKVVKGMSPSEEFGEAVCRAALAAIGCLTGKIEEPKRRQPNGRESNGKSQNMA